MIELDSVSVVRGTMPILDRVTLSFGTEVVAVVGPSGAGKTTILRVLLGLEACSSGTVRIDSRVMSHGKDVVVLPEERNIAMVFQDLALWPHFSVHGNLAFGLRARGTGKVERERRIAHALASVGLDGKAARFPQELSGGERQRVAVARALVLDPVALLLDEPLESLDVALKDEMIALFARVFRERPMPVLYVTHDPREAACIADRLVVLENGRVSQQGTIVNLRTAPATRFVEAFTRAACAASA